MASGTFMSSAGRQALEGAAIAPGGDATLSALQDPERRPPEPLPFHIRDFQQLKDSSWT